MQTFIHILKIISGPLIGAVIGYITNYIAVKMLFRPYYPKRIGKIRIPFTPGIIPKRKKALAKAVGKAVGENLFTGDDIKNAFLTDLDTNVYYLKFKSLIYEQNISSLVAKFADSQKFKNDFINRLTDIVYNSLKERDLGAIVAEQGKKAAIEKKSSLGMLSFMITDGMIDKIMESFRQKTNDYIESNGRKLVYSEVSPKVEGLFDSTISQTAKLTEDKVKNVYLTLCKILLENMLDGLDISAVVESKIDEMDVKELEKLCLSVMKKELGAIVNLGALIGFVVGIIYIFI